MVKSRIKEIFITNPSDYTKNVEAMFDAVRYDVVEMILESC